MFHTLFDYQDQNVANNKQIPKTKSKGFINKTSKNKNLYENYYGKGNQAYDLYNKNDNDSNNSQSSDNESEKFEKTTNKVRVILYKNGFILNNGPFRDKSVPENEEFLEQMGRGVIPHELVDEKLKHIICQKNIIFLICIIMIFLIILVILDKINIKKILKIIKKILYL